MTDPEFADRTYIEPMTVEVLERIIAAEKPDALLPTIGGQTGLNLALELAEAGVLEQYGVRADRRQASTRSRGPRTASSSRTTMRAIGLDLPQSGIARSLEEARGGPRRASACPLIIRPSRTLGGTGGGIATTEAEFEANVALGARRLADARGADRGVDRRLEGVRARGDARRARTTSSSSARSRTSTRWACTPATRSPSRRRRR